MFFLSSHFLQHGRSDSYRVATLPKIRDDNKTADGMYKVFTAVLPVRGGSLHLLFLAPLFSPGFASSTTYFLESLLQSFSFHPRRINLSLSLSFSTNHFPSFRSNYHGRFPRNIPPFGTHLKIPLFSLLLFFLTTHFCRSSSSPWFKGNFSTILFIGVVLLHNA